MRKQKCFDAFIENDGSNKSLFSMRFWAMLSKMDFIDESPSWLFPGRIIVVCRTQSWTDLSLFLWENSAEGNGYKMIVSLSKQLNLLILYSACFQTHYYHRLIELSFAVRVRHSYPLKVIVFVPGRDKMIKIMLFNWMATDNDLSVEDRFLSILHFSEVKQTSLKRIRVRTDGIRRTIASSYLRFSITNNHHHHHHQSREEEKSLTERNADALGLLCWQGHRIACITYSSVNDFDFDLFGKRFILRQRWWKRKNEKQQQTSFACYSLCRVILRLHTWEL